MCFELEHVSYDRRMFDQVGVLCVVEIRTWKGRKRSYVRYDVYGFPRPKYWNGRAFK